MQIGDTVKVRDLPNGAVFTYQPGYDDSKHYTVKYHENNIVWCVGGLWFPSATLVVLISLPEQFKQVETVTPPWLLGRWVNL